MAKLFNTILMLLLFTAPVSIPTIIGLALATIGIFFGQPFWTTFIIAALSSAALGIVYIRNSSAMRRSFKSVWNRLTNWRDW